jgi:NAD/NADP transhydrogenase alpha subunit
MKHSKQIPMRLKIDVLIIIVGLGVIALGIVITTARILGASVQEYARLVPF